MQDYELANGDVEAPAARAPAAPSPGMLQYMRSKEAQLGMLSMLLLVRPPLWLSSSTPDSLCTSLPSQPQELGAGCELMGCLVCSHVCARCCAMPGTPSASHTGCVGLPRHPRGSRTAPKNDLHSCSVACMLLSRSGGACPPRSRLSALHPGLIDTYKAHTPACLQGTHALSNAGQQAQALRPTPVWLQVFQGTALSLVLRFSRTQAGTQYLGSVTVIFTEAAKLLICIVAQLSVCRQDTAQGDTAGFSTCQACHEEGLPPAGGQLPGCMRAHPHRCLSAARLCHAAALLPDD